MELFINIPIIKGQAEEDEKTALELGKMSQRLEDQLHGLQEKEFLYIRDSLKHIVFELNVEERGMKAMASCLRDAAKAYENTERIISSSNVAKGNIKEPEITADVQREIDAAYENGEIDDKSYNILNSIISGLTAFGMATLQEALTGIIQDKTAEAIADAAIAWIKQNTSLFMDRKMVASLAGVGEAYLTQTPSWLASLIRGGAKYGVPIVGTLLDYTIQVTGGEESGDALIKAGAHTAIGFGAAAAGTAIVSAASGTAIGAKIGAVVGSAIPGAGTIAGAAVGAIIGAVGTVAFDYVYDNWDDIVEGAGNLIDTAGDWLSSAGNAVVDAFQGLGSIFG